MTTPSLRIRAEGGGFIREDGSPFIPLGTTAYALLYQPEERIRQTLDTLSASPFNKLRFCLFPKYYRFNGERLLPEPELFPFEKTDGRWDISRPYEPFWARAEALIRSLGELDIQADVILFHPYDEGHWGFDHLSMAENRRYLDLCLERLGKYDNVWWSAANEYDLCRWKTPADWRRLIAYIARRDGGRHLLSCHNGMAVWDALRSPVTHASVQSHSMWRIPDWSAAFRKPIVIDECGYEGNLREIWGSVSGRELTRRFWQACAVGGYASHGETYHTVGEPVWWAMGGMLRGESVERLRFLKGLLEELPGPLVYAPAMESMATLSDPKFLKLVMKKRNPRGALADLVCRFAPKDAESFVRAVFAMDEADLLDMKAGQMSYSGWVGENAFLRYYGIRTSAEDTLELPAGHTYRVELIDTWNMTRELLCDGASGATLVRLPGREDMAVLAVKIR